MKQNFSLVLHSFSVPFAKGTLLNSDSDSSPGVLLTPLLFHPTHCVRPSPVSCSSQRQETQSRCYCCCCCCCCLNSALAQEPSQTAQSSDQGSSWEHFRKAF